MFGLGTAELLILLTLALIVIGPRNLPELARSLGKGLGEFKRATREVQESLYRSATTETLPTEPASAEPTQPRETSSRQHDSNTRLINCQKSSALIIISNVQLSIIDQKQAVQSF